MMNPDQFINYGIKTSLVSSALGTCTLRHRDVVYKYNNFQHLHALTLAYLASNLVDAAKSGLCLRNDKFERFLKSLCVPVPDYVKPKGERRGIRTSHIMDILVLNVIPSFQENVLAQFHQRVPAEHDMPIDPDILAFYRQMKERYPKVVDELRRELHQVRAQWSTCFQKHMNNRSQQKEDVTCSPKRRAKRVVARASSIQLVLFLILDKF